MNLAGALKGKKTYVASALTILGAIAGYLTGDITGMDAIRLIDPAILAMALRNGISSASN